MTERRHEFTREQLESYILRDTPELTSEEVAGS